MSFAKEILVAWDSQFESIPRGGSTEGKKTGNLRPETGKFGPRMDANPRESLEGCPPWQPQIQAAQAPLRQNTSSHGATKHTEEENPKADFGPRMDANPRESPRILGGLSSVAAQDPGAQAPLRKNTSSHGAAKHTEVENRKAVLAREWTQILANPWRAVLRGSHRFSRAGAVAKKYILSRSHKAHGGGKPKSRFFPANGRESLEGCPPWQPQIQACRHRYEKNTSHGAAKHTEGETGNQILARDANPRVHQRD
jgi:hypothetical protein